jgi:outer membrane lipoprotein LolB
MTKHYFSLPSFFLVTSIILSGCATKPDSSLKNDNKIVTSEQRAEELLKNKKWQLKGKIAFIQEIKNNEGIEDKRESASIIWQVNENKQTQELNLTSYLGINVLQLKSNQDQHLIKVDGKEYRGTNLSQLIYSLTGLPLPTEALNFWLKGLPYKTDDVLKTDENTQLPKSMSSYYHNALWQINYSNYQRFDGFNMATKFIIKKENLLIKVAIKNWSLFDYEAN